MKFRLIKRKKTLATAFAATSCLLVGTLPATATETQASPVMAATEGQTAIADQSQHPVSTPVDAASTTPPTPAVAAIETPNPSVPAAAPTQTEAAQPVAPENTTQVNPNPVSSDTSISLPAPTPMAATDYLAKEQTADKTVPAQWQDLMATSMDQVTSVSQLSDVRPTDWAFQALQSLVEKYGCIVGYPDRTFRGKRAMTRYEFAAGLNACMERMTELLASATADLVKKEDMVLLQKMMEQFAAELATVRGKVDALEARTAQLETQQFSPTTKLFGQVIMGAQGRTSKPTTLFGIPFDDPGPNVNTLTNVQLSLFTQFSPRAILLTGLQAGAGSTRPALTNDTRLSFEGDTGNSRLVLSDLTFRYLATNNLALIVGPAGVNMVNVFRGANRVESAGSGPLSAFAQRNPILNIGAGRAGVGFDWQINPVASVQGVFSSSLPDDPANGGIFVGNNTTTTMGLQLALVPTQDLDLTINYVHSYSPFGFLLTGVGDDQVALPLDGSGKAPLTTNAVGTTVAWRANRRLTVGGWVGYTNSTISSEVGAAETINWMAFLNFPDLGKRGNLGGIYVGQPPRIFSSNFETANPFLTRNIPDFTTNGGLNPGGQPGSTTHVELFYRHRVTDNISITPGFIVVFNPRNNPVNDTVMIGAIRATFTF